MNAESTINYLASQEGYKLKPRHELDDIDTRLPYFQIIKQIDGNYKTVGYNYEKHDNADRMVFITQLLDQHTLPRINKSYDASGYYNIELHDTYSYLNNNCNYDNCLTWSKRKVDQNVVLLPDLYHIINFGGKLNDVDTTAWSHKPINKVGFFGTTTGDGDPLQNERIKTCIWSIDKRAWTDMYITKIAQMTPQRIADAYPEFQKVVHPMVHHTNLFKYKFLLDIPGNTCSWDRVPLILNSQSLLFKMPCRDMCFYYPLLQEGEHYVSVNRDNMQDMYNYYNNHMEESRRIIKNANRFAKQYLRPDITLTYLKTLFETSAMRHGK